MKEFIQVFSDHASEEWWIPKGYFIFWASPKLEIDFQDAERRSINHDSWKILQP
jgi:hypothetical protein